MNRPSHLPDFEFPPLNEVVLGVQFARPQGYQQIHSGEVWNLFRERFPAVEEHNALQPEFEIFGLPQGSQKIRFDLMGPSHDRFWFLTKEKDELIQFQHDRLMHNWRKIDDGKNPYPRFEKMLENFTSEMKTLEKYFSERHTQKLNINQCELSYFNHIPINEKDGLSPDTWLNFCSFKNISLEDFHVNFRRKIENGGKPIGRIVCEAGNAINSAGKAVLLLSITARGAPKSNDISTAIEFFSSARDLIVNLFTEITTPQAHKVWGRKK